MKKIYPLSVILLCLVITLFSTESSSLLAMSSEGGSAGCMDENACNYNADATEPDGSCTYPEPGGDCDGNCLITPPNILYLLNNYWEANQSGECNYYGSSQNVTIIFDEEGVYHVINTQTYEIENTGTYILDECMLLINGVADFYFTENESFQAQVKGCLNLLPDNHINVCPDPAACNYVEGIESLLLDTSDIYNNCNYPNEYEDCDNNCLSDQNNNEICDNEEGYANISDPEDHETYIYEFEVDYSLEDNFVSGSIKLNFYDQNTDELLSEWTMIDENNGEFDYLVGADPASYSSVISATAPLTEGAYSVTVSYMMNEENGFEYTSSPEYFQIQEITGCLDETACNYSPLATIDSEMCLFSNEQLSCPENMTITLDEGDLTAVVTYETPELSGQCENPDFLAEFPEFDSLPEHIEDNFQNWLINLPNHQVWDYDGEYNTQGQINFIDDGFNDMYDDGNFISTNFESEIAYTTGQITSSEAFGAGSRYFTHELPGMFFLAAEPANVEYFEIDGNLGADGDGFVTTHHFEIGNYQAYYKGVCAEGEDPSINHLIIIPNGIEATQYYDDESEDDYHEITGIENADIIYYILWAGIDSYCFSEEEIAYFLGVNQTIETQLVAGLESGSEFPIGTTEIGHIAITGENEFEFCSFTVTVNSLGCTDSEACNYSDAANLADDSCEFPEPFEDCDGNCVNDLNDNQICDELEVEGCTDSEAVNYNEDAYIDDGSCQYDCSFPVINISNVTCDDQFIYIDLDVMPDGEGGLFFLENTANNQTLALDSEAQSLNINFPYGGPIVLSLVSDQYSSCVMDLSEISCDVSITEVEAIELDVYPNPAGDVITLTSSQSGLMNLEILDLAGKLVHSEQYYMNANGIQLDVNHLSDGTYIIRTSDEVSTTTKKLIILHN